ncbi:MAG: hypothetical protein IAE78_25900 [Myxococcus sp.]|nr:hypothetical protein [Myxococcus sp.]
MKTTWTMRSVVAALTALVVLGGCGGASVDEFREAAPSSLGIDIAMRKGKGQALGLGEPALMPGATGLAAYLVNGNVALVLGTVATVVATEPKKLTAKAAEWGPVSKPLWKNEFTLSMTRNGGTYTYEGKGRPRAGGEFTSVITGTHTLTATGSEGSFTLDYDGLQKLSDPPNTVGKAVVTYTRTRAGDLTLAIDFVQTGAPDSPKRTDSKYTFSQVQNGEGHLEFVIDSNYVSRSAALERLSIKSRWTWAGSGRSDVVGSNGDLTTPVQFTECWDTAHNRTHYNDTLNLFPTEGLAGDCVFQEASFSRL